MLNWKRVWSSNNYLDIQWSWVLAQKKTSMTSWPCHNQYKHPQTYLIGGFNPPEKYWSDWIIIPTIGENKIHVPNHQPVYWFIFQIAIGYSNSIHKISWSELILISWSKIDRPQKTILYIYIYTYYIYILYIISYNYTYYIYNIIYIYIL